MASPPDKREAAQDKISSRRNFSKGILCAPALVAGIAGVASSIAVPGIAQAQSSATPSPPGTPPAPTFKPVGVERSKVLKVLSGRNRPDLTPVYLMWEQMSGMKVDLTKISHLDVTERLTKERNDPQFDLMIENTNAEPEIARAAGLFEPYRASVAQNYPEWLRAPDYAWISFSAWPRTAMVNWATMGRDPKKWPKRFEDLAEPEFKDKVLIASIQESIVTSYVSALRASKGDSWTTKLLNRMLDNGMRIYKSHAQMRHALVREHYGVALVNSSNAHVFFLEGNATSEVWLDQEEGGLGTLIESHTTAVIKGARNPTAARDFIDFLLSKEIQELLARLYGEVPVNPAAMTGWVPKVTAIKRMKATTTQIAAGFHDTQRYLTELGFNMEDNPDAFVSQGRSGRRRDNVAWAEPAKK